MKEKRQFSFDLIRSTAVFCILLCHFNARYSFLYYGDDLKEYMLLSQYPFRLFLGDLGVSLFFIISGASLYYNHRETLDLKEFYKKRFLAIFPMFWIAYGILFILRAPKMLASGTPIGYLVLTVIGMDGYLSGVLPTFYLIGEWFLGCIILIYLIFPALRLIFRRNRWITWVIVIGLYLLFDMVNMIPMLGKSSIVFIRLPEVLFGMEYAEYLCSKKTKDEEDGDSLDADSSSGIPEYIAVTIAAAVLVFSSFVDITWDNSIQTTVVGIAFFTVLAFVSDNILSRYMRDDKGSTGVLRGIFTRISRYSYAVFLIHHIIINLVCDRLDMLSLSLSVRVGLFIGLIFIIFIGALVLTALLHFCYAACGKLKRRK